MPWWRQGQNFKLYVRWSGGRLKKLEGFIHGIYSKVPSPQSSAVLLTVRLRAKILGAMLGEYVSAKYERKFFRVVIILCALDSEWQCEEDKIHRRLKWEYSPNYRWLYAFDLLVYARCCLWVGKTNMMCKLRCKSFKGTYVGAPSLGSSKKSYSSRFSGGGRPSPKSTDRQPYTLSSPLLD